MFKKAVQSKQARQYVGNGSSGGNTCNAKAEAVDQDKSQHHIGDVGSKPDSDGQLNLHNAGQPALSSLVKQCAGYGKDNNVEILPHI